MYMIPTLTGGISCPVKEFPFKDLPGSPKNAPCQVIHVATHCYTEEEVHGLITSLKSLLIHNQNAIELHIVTSSTTHWVLNHYFNTWELQQVEVHFYTSTSKLSALDFVLLEDLPSNPESVILFQPGAFFNKDIKALWLHAGKKPQVIEPVVPSTQESKLILPKVPPAAIILRLHLLNNVTDCRQKDLILSDLVVPIKYAFVIKCQPSVFESESVKEKVTSDLYQYEPYSFDGIFTKSTSMNEMEEKIYKDMQSIDVYSLPGRSVDVSCRYTFQKKVLLLNTSKSMDDPCYTFRYAACSAYVTHLYFHNMKPSAMSGPIRSDSQVSAVIQLQFNRFSSLKRIYERWEGPIHVVLYLNQTESQLVQAELKKDTKLRRENICYHVVYKQFVNNPINMLRNIGIKEVRTEYLFVLDVDFVPSVSLDNHLLDRARQQEGNTHKAFIVPAFEALVQDYMVPNTKNQLLVDMGLERVIPYHQRWNQFSKGHAPTKYNIWITAQEPYEVEHQKEFEPYVMLKTVDSPLFYEIQLERMGDKFTYVLEIHKKGFHLVVLDNVFMVHLPHPQSYAHSLVTRNFQRCFQYFYNTIDANLKH